MLAEIVGLRYNGAVLVVFLNVILPTFLVAATGALFQRWRKLPVGVLSQVTLYLFVPALIFDALVNVDLAAGAFLRVVGAMLLASLLLGAVSLLASLALRHDRPMRSGFLLAAVFPNAGNIALPVILLAFGEAGLAPSIIIFVVYVAISWSAGVFIASQSQLRPVDAVKQVLRVPVVYAVAVAGVLLATGWRLPTTLAHPIALLADGAFPAMLVVLGFQVAAGLHLSELPSMAAALLLRLVVAGPLAYLATLVLGLDGLGQQVLIVVAAMPTAVFTTIVSTEFDASPRFVTSTVVASTGASMVTLTVVISAVQQWLA